MLWKQIPGPLNSPCGFFRVSSADQTPVTTCQVPHAAERDSDHQGTKRSSNLGQKPTWRAPRRRPPAVKISVAGCAHWGESHHNHEPGTRYAYSHSASLFSQVSIYPQENQHRQLTENPGGAFRPSPYSGLRGPTWLSCRPLPWLRPTPHCPHCTWPPQMHASWPFVWVTPDLLLPCPHHLLVDASSLPPRLQLNVIYSSQRKAGTQSLYHVIASFLPTGITDFLCSDHHSLFCLLSCLLC